MKNKYIAICLLFVVAWTSCTSILDKKDLSAITESDVWNDKDYATAYLNKLYRENLPKWDANVAIHSDEAYGNSGILYGQLTTNSTTTWNYTAIRNINLLFEGVKSGTIPTETQELLIGQASVLRAWRYFEMVRQYGGIPLIFEPQKLTDDLYVTRNKTSECIDAVVKDLDYAIEVLPWEWTGDDVGRFTKAGAYALKGRILLYNASPQFNPENKQDRWQIAYEANKLAKEEIEKNGYGLYESYEDIWFDEMNKEVLLVKRYQEPGETHDWDAGTRPLSEAQNFSGNNQPTLEMVESYPMSTGVSIKESADYDPVFYWKNRDPRFASTIAYNGCLWELSNKSGRQQWTYREDKDQIYNATATGFYCRKAINVSYTPYYTERSSTDWIEIRYAEVLLNYAECAAELGKLDEAYNMLTAIRKRAGIIPGANNLYGLEANMPKDEMISAIMLERRIEFAFEGKRYWDLRRRRLFESELNGTRRHGVVPVLLTDAKEFEAIRGSIDLNKDYPKYFKDSIRVVDEKFDINFLNNYYFYAIENKHLEGNSKLEQTQGWDNGAFNPYD